MLKLLCAFIIEKYILYFYPENNYQSPYAQPLRFILTGPPRRRAKKKPPPPMPSDEPHCPTGRIKIKIRMAHKHDTESTEEEKSAGEGDNGTIKVVYFVNE